MCPRDTVTGMRLAMHRLPVPQYRAELVILYGTTSAMASVVADHRVPTEAFRDFVAADDEVLYGSTSNVCGGTGEVRRSIYVFIDSSQSAEEKLGTIVHECFHAVVRLMHDIGQKIRPNTDEPAAYLLEWAVKETRRVCR